jgi:aspartate 1-decarboxylase
MMKVQMLRAKLHQACVTQADVDYEGSLGIDVELMEAVGLHPYEKILVADINNGNRFETYAIAEPFGSRRMVLNGAAARLGSVGDRLIVMSFCWVDEAVIREGKFRPRVIRLNEHNEPVPHLPAASSHDDVARMLEA